MNALAIQIGKRLKAARKAAGYRSATAFATEQAIPMSTYSQHESGKRQLNADMLIYYCEQLGIQPGWLLSGEGVPYAAGTQNLEHRLGVIDELLAGISRYSAQETELAPITTTIAKVDMLLFKEVLIRLLPVFAQANIQITEIELVEFAIEVYNGVVTTSASMSDKIAMIELSIASLKRGVLKQDLPKSADQQKMA